MPTNDFLPFATAGGAGVLTQSEYAALAARLSGFVDGIAEPTEVNKVWRQASVMAAVIGQFIGDYGALDALDNGSVANLVRDLARSVQRGSYAYIAAGGTANALTATPTPAITAYTAGITLRLLTGASANSGAMTINVSGVGAVALQNSDGSAIAAGAVAATSMIEIICDGTNWRIKGMRAATAAEVEAGTINNAAVTPLSLVNRRNPYFIANGSSLFSIPNGVDTKVDNISSLASSFFNSGSGFASSAFTCGAKDAGAWLFIGYAALQMLTTSTEGYDYRLSIAKNAATGAFSTCFIAYAGTFGLTVATPYVLAAGDVVDLRAFQNTSTNRNVGATLLFGIRLGNS